MTALVRYYTEAMVERQERLHKQWKDAGDGYYSMFAVGPLSGLGYIAIPVGHPDQGKAYDELEVPVDGGCTFANDNVFGWDYGHGFEQKHDFHADVRAAITFFKGRASDAQAPKAIGEGDVPR